jgi:hypothetical protein
MMEYYVLIKPWAVYVKEAEFFVAQGGLTESWGKGWQKIEAESIADARLKGEVLRRL